MKINNKKYIYNRRREKKFMRERYLRTLFGGNGGELGFLDGFMRM